MRRWERDERRRHELEMEFQDKKIINMEKEFNQRLREAEKTASDARKQRDEQIQRRRLAEELAQTADEVRQEALRSRAETARQLVKMHVAAGTRLMESDDLSASLSWL